MKPLRDNDRHALLTLLDDDDPHVRQLLEDNFIQMGGEGLAFLEAAARNAEPGTQLAAQQFLQAIRQRNAWESFEKFCATSGVNADLETGALLLARTRYPELDELPYRARLDEMARELKKRLTGRETPRSTIEVCNHYLFRTLGFRGNRQDYYDPDNSYLNRVLDRRLGNPITLSTVYLLVGRRLGLPLAGVNLPGHFLVKWQSSGAQFYVDAFQQGHLLHETECAVLCERLGHAFRPAHLTAVPPRLILHRMCRNLQSIYAENDPPRAARLLDLIARLARD